MKRGAACLYQELPWLFITKHAEGVVVQKDGLLQKTYAYRAPDIDSSGSRAAEALVVRVNDCVKRIGSAWAFFVEAQRFSIADYDAAGFDYAGGRDFSLLAPYLIDREREADFRAAGRHFESSYYITFVYKPPSENVKQLTQMFISSGTGEKEGKSVRENAEAFAAACDNIASLLSDGMLIKPLTNAETAAYLHSSVSMKRHPIRFPCTSLMLDRLLPDTGVQNSLTLKLGEYYIPIIGVADFPSESYPAILDDLNRERLEYRWVTRYICAGKEEGVKTARKKEKTHRGNKKSFLQVFAESTSGEETKALNHGEGVKEADSIEAGIEIENDQASLGYMTTCVMVWDTDYEAAREKAKQVMGVINRAGFTCKEEIYQSFEAWKSMMPGQVYANWRSLPVMSYSLAHVVPLSSIWPGQRYNEHAKKITGLDLPLLTCSTLEGTPFYLNLNVGDVGHTAVWGPTGAGKSTLLNLIEMQFLKYPNSRVIVFDKGRSARLPCLSCGGLFYEPAGEGAGAVSFQPLRELETDADLLSAIEFIETCLAVSGYTVTPPQRAKIKEGVELLRDKGLSQRTLTSFEMYSQYTDEETGRLIFKERLADYFWDGGKYGKIFDNKGTGLSLDSRYIVIEMEQLMNRGPGCVIPALIYLFNFIEKKFDGRLTLLVLDEAWLFLRNEAFSAKIAEWLKVLRKKNVYVVFATQDVADVAASPLRTTILQQCVTKIYLADPSAATAAMANIYSDFGLSDSEIELLASSRMKRDYFYTSPLGRRLFQLDLGPLALALIGAADHKALDALARTYAPATPLCRMALDRKAPGWRQYLGPDAPEEKPPEKRAESAAESGAGSEAPRARNPFAPPEKSGESKGSAQQTVAELKTPDPTIQETGAVAKTFDEAELARAVETRLLNRRNKRGAGRAAEQIAGEFNVSQATVFRVKKLLSECGGETAEAIKRGDKSISDARRELKGASGKDGEEAEEGEEA